jgi:hypothetical protein
MPRFLCNLLNVLVQIANKMGLQKDDRAVKQRAKKATPYYIKMQSILNHSTKTQVTVCLTPTLLIPWGNSPWYQLYKKLDGSLSWSVCYEREKTS